VRIEKKFPAETQRGKEDSESEIAEVIFPQSRRDEWALGLVPIGGPIEDGDDAGGYCKSELEDIYREGANADPDYDKADNVKAGYQEQHV